MYGTPIATCTAYTAKNHSDDAPATRTYRTSSLDRSDWMRQARLAGYLLPVAIDLPWILAGLIVTPHAESPRQRHSRPDVRHAWPCGQHGAVRRRTAQVRRRRDTSGVVASPDRWR